jgi:hypothetical protein
VLSPAEDENQDGQSIQEQPGLKEGGGSVCPEIVTDRPDITESGIVVPKGSLQGTVPLLWRYASRFTLFDHIFQEMTGPPRWEICRLSPPRMAATSDQGLSRSITIRK